MSVLISDAPIIFHTDLNWVPDKKIEELQGKMDNYTEAITQSNWSDSYTFLSWNSVSSAEFESNKHYGAALWIEKGVKKRETKTNINEQEQSHDS